MIFTAKKIKCWSKYNEKSIYTCVLLTIENFDDHTVYIFFLLNQICGDHPLQRWISPNFIDTPPSRRFFLKIRSSSSKRVMYNWYCHSKQLQFCSDWIIRPNFSNFADYCHITSKLCESFFCCLIWWGALEILILTQLWPIGYFFIIS